MVSQIPSVPEIRNLKNEETAQFLAQHVRDLQVIPLC